MVLLNFTGRWGYRKGENAGNSSSEEGGSSSQENVGIGGRDNEEQPVGRGKHIYIAVIISRSLPSNI